MAQRYVFGSLTRISDLEARPFLVKQLKKTLWKTGDYVVGKFVPRSNNPIHEEVETTTGRLRPLIPGDLLVGALGVRTSTKESVGDWHMIAENDGKMHDICGSGMFGMETSYSKSYGPSACFVYQGHAMRDGAKVCMKDFVVQKSTNGSTSYSSPTILIIGTSMSCGKTYAARSIIRQLKNIGIRKVVGTKLTGAGFLNDTMSMDDAGADATYDFVDVGLPSTVLPAQEYKKSLHTLLSIVSSEEPDIVVAEAGASPCEPYNGDIVLQEMVDKANLVVLCASDSYAVVGAVKLLENARIRPDFVTGMITSTSAGMDLIRCMCDIPPLNLSSEEGITEFKKLVKHTIPSLSGL